MFTLWQKPVVTESFAQGLRQKWDNWLEADGFPSPGLCLSRDSSWPAASCLALCNVTIFVKATMRLFTSMTTRPLIRDAIIREVGDRKESWTPPCRAVRAAPSNPGRKQNKNQRKEDRKGVLPPTCGSARVVGTCGQVQAWEPGQLILHPHQPGRRVCIQHVNTNKSPLSPGGKD